MAENSLMLLRLVFLLLLLGGACALYYEDGFDHYYTYSSESDILGLHNVTSVIKFRIRAVNFTDEGFLNMLMVDNFVQYTEKGYYTDNPLKWDLDREFLFFVAKDGLVTMVHHHPDDQSEILSLKKVLASTLSAKVVIKKEAKWDFTSVEEDHAGTLKHDYTGEKTSKGLKFQRTHTSSTNVIRSHNKTLLLDHNGTPLEVESVDNITLHHDTNTFKRKLMDGEEEILDEQSGEFPRIGTVSKNRLKLDAKRPHNENDYRPPNNLKRDKLLITHKEPEKVSLDTVEQDVKKNLKCIRSYENKYERNRTECVNALRKLFMSVHDDDFLRLASKVLTRECDVNDTMCNDERSLFIDLVGGHGSSAAQKLFLELIILQPNVSEEDMRRFLFHCIALKNPIPEVVQLVEHLCHSEVKYIEGVPSMTKTGKRACLSLGAMAKSLHDTNVTVSDRIVERLEARLEPHNQTQTAEITKPRHRRSISQVDRSTRKHIETKMVLLQSLGNAAKKRSLRHIKSYLEPNTGHTVWRRAAAHSLRHFKCDESATVLMEAAVHDKDGVVRETAQKVLSKHPKAGSITREQEDIVLSANYTYPMVARVRRGAREILEKLFEGFAFRFEAPGIEWDKTIGTKDIGASMGLTIRNLIDLAISLMEGHFLADSYNGAFAEVHVAMLDFEIDIIKAFVCFKGHINYNMNILKDFGINEAQDLLNIYDKILEKIVNPIKAVIDGFKNIIQMFRDGTMTEVFNSFKATIRALPTMAGDVAMKFRDFLKDLYSIAGTVVVEELRLMVGHIRHFIDGVIEEVLKLYTDVKDAVSAALPFIGKKIKEAFNLIVDAFKEIIDAPVQGFTAMTRGISHIKTAVAMAVDVKDKVVKTCGLVKGRVMKWMDTAKTIPAMLRRAQAAYEKAFGKMGETGPAPGGSAYSDGVQPMKNSITILRDEIMAKWEQVLKPFRDLMEVSQPFLKQFRNIKELIKGVKWAYKNLKDVIEIGKSVVQKVFGPKFHPKFLTIRRREDDSCEAGMWPTDTNGNYKTTGVDIVVGAGQTIVCPVDAIIHLKGGSNRVVLQPTETEFAGLEIVIDNIAPLKDNVTDGKRFKAGDTIGKGIDVDICKDNFIHLAVRQAMNETQPDSEYQYMDPSLFLDKWRPLSKWIQECMDYEFRFIGQTFESGDSEDEENNGEPVSKIDKLKRSFEESIGSKEDLEESMNSRLADLKRRSISDIIGAIGKNVDWGDNLGNSVKENAEKFQEFFKTSFFNQEPKVPDVLDIVNTNDKTVGWIKDKLNANSGLFSKFNGIIGKLASGLTEIPTDNAKLQPLTYLKRLFPSIEGGVTELAEKLQTNAENLCTMFVDAISSQHMCIPRCDCMGIVCTLNLPTAHKLTSLKIGFYLNLEKTQLEILFNNNLFLLEVDGLDHTVDLGFKVLGMTISLVGNIELNLDKFSMTIEAKICSDLLQICFPNIEVLTDIQFSTIAPEAIDSKDCSPDGESLGDLLDASGEVHEMNIPDFINSLGDFSGMINTNLTDVFDSLSDHVEDELMGEPVDDMGIVTVEFHDSVDFCISARIKIPTFEIEFFSIRHIFMIGPVPLGLGFGAGGAVGLGVKINLCIMTMKLKVILMPWVGGKVWGDVAVDIGFARGGLRIIGIIMETKFIVTGELAFTKFPIDLGARLDLVLVPVKLKLKGFAELNLLVKKVTIWEGNIWEYACPTINKNIFIKHTLNKDMSPPEILPTTLHNLGEKKRPKREDQEGCSVHQVRGRSHRDTAFQLDMNAQDPTSDVKMSYTIGTHKGGTNVQNWTDIGGFSILEPAQLPGGVPLYWTVKAKNSEGLEATAQCSLDTFDNTLPAGRVEHAYKYSSHPGKLIASVVVFEDSPLADVQSAAIGYSPGEFGSQFIYWHLINLGQSSERIGGYGSLKKFTVPRLGALIAPTLQSQNAETDDHCAKVCLDYGSNCVSFDYDASSQTCDLHDRVEGANAYLRVSGSFQNYERLGTGYHAPLEYTDLELLHGTTYYINAMITNELGYVNYLFGEGTMMDFTPPEPGPIGEASQDILRADGCTASLLQQCLDVTWLENHRVIIDGPGAETIFNGHEPFVDKLYTLTNHYITANWHGFHDDESGIFGYTWAVGREVCATDILDYNDPHDHLASRNFWTHSGFEKGFHLSDGQYYVTVQALNNAELGGSLVTTVCHSTPFSIDTSPPTFRGVTEIIYDEDFDLIAIYYEATDDLSGIKNTEFGLGKTKYDVQLRAYSLHPALERTDPFVSVEDLGLQEGIPAWIRIRVTNNVNLFTAGHGDEPILIDRSPPFAGEVLDGNKLQRDSMYQSDNASICAQWINFYDPESGIDSFLWGVGTEPAKDDIVEFRTLTQYDKSGCTAAVLEHNVTYYSTVIAYNNALNSKPAEASSDGILVDTTPPLTGLVVDGKETDVEDLMYTSESVTKSCHWSGFSDPESGVEKYLVDVYVNNQLQETFDVEQAETFEDKTISLEHSDFVHFKVHGVNGAELSASVDSNGFLVDHTPPALVGMSDSRDGLPYQSNDSVMHLMWHFRDEESGIKEFRTTILETKEGIKQKVWPPGEPYNSSTPTTQFPERTDIVLENLELRNGGKYSLHVTSLNGALLSTAHESVGVIVDMTPPNTPKVHIGLLHEDEDLNEEGQVLHSDQHGILVSWSGRDSESGIKDFLVAVGKQENPECVIPFTSYGTTTSSYIGHIYLEPSANATDTYVVSVQATNGAGITSATGQSKPIYVQKANVAGVVFDGRALYQDEIYTVDRTSLAGSFYGFESDTCNIQGYEWAIGNEPFGTNILTYTSYGVVMEDEDHGYMQVHTELYENSVYYITVRAVTGCRDEFIVSSSNGITLDTKSPVVTFIEKANNDTILKLHNGVYYQDTTDSIHLTATVEDVHEIRTSEWALGSSPMKTDLHEFTNDLTRITNAITLIPGQAAFLTASTSDRAGNKKLSYSQPIIGDNTPPHLSNLVCTKYASSRQGLITCKWDEVVEYESIATSILISIGTEPELGDILYEFNQPLTTLEFSKDLTIFMKNNLEVTALFIEFRISNIVERTNEYVHKVIIDGTPPIVNGVNVSTRTNDKLPFTTMKCQLPTSFVEVSVDSFEDAESGIDENRFEVAIGSDALAADILTYKRTTPNNNNLFFIDNLTLQFGQKFYVTVRSYNKAGLNGESSSEMVVVSQSPFLEVIDGEDDLDVDFQPSPNVIRGSWRYSDDCPIVEASWKLTNLLGHVLSDYRLIPRAENSFYDDEVKLQVGVKYFVIVKTFDAMNRTKIARSDGVTVRIQPPYPGAVRDGLDEDINYQFSVTELSANWDEFGDSSKDPTQSISYYEVAIGNDLRNEDTRANVHFFVNVGLNKKYTFTNLNLTAKVVTFYITVRAHSFAGGLVEGFSNGVKVGFDENIIPGSLVSDHYQYSTESIEFSWSKFQSDIGIMQYIVGISSQRPFIMMDSLDCSLISTNETIFDIAIEHVGLNEYVKVDDLSLNHTFMYFPSVMAEDESGLCSLVTGHSITVDITPPENGSIYINSLLSDSLLFAQSQTEMEVSWKRFVDQESGIDSVEVTLLDCGKCDADHSSCVSLDEETAQNDTAVTFYELQLVPNNIYKVRLVVTNRAGKYIVVYSKAILLDLSAPNAGIVKITDDWTVTRNFQYKNDAIHAKMAVTLFEEIYNCANQIVIYPPIKKSLYKWSLFDTTYNKDFYTVNKTGGYFGIGYNADLSAITRSGVLSSEVTLRGGQYSSIIRCAKGPNIVTTLAFVSTRKAVLFEITNKPVESNFDVAEFENKTGLSADNNQTDTKVPGMLKPSNDSRESNTSYFSTDEFGYGFHILGYKIGNNTNFHGLFWAQSKYAKVERWFQFEFDPTAAEHAYKISVEKYVSNLQELTDLILIIDDIERVDITGLELGTGAKIALLTWNENGSKPIIEDVFKPFYSDAFIKYIEIPNENEKECRYGKAFFDGESGIKEIWAGVSDNASLSDNIAPFQLVHQFCPSCKGFCNDTCGDPCPYEVIDKEYLIIDLERNDLHLNELSPDEACFNITSDQSCNSTSYYITTKVVNFAGKVTYAHSNAIQVDITPPTCGSMHCLDPEYAEDEPVEYLGSTSSIGSYWNCTDDISLVDHYEVLVASLTNNTTIMSPVNVGGKTRVKFDLGEGTFKNKQDYVVKTTVVNTAGMSASYNCSLRAFQDPPDIQSTILAPIHAVELESLPNTHFVEAPDTVGVKWESGKEDTQFYEWQLGTTPGGTDLFPPVLVGTESSGIAAIENGKLVLDEVSTNKALAEFKPADTQTILVVDSSEEKDQSFFSMEPGRCVFHTVSAVGYSHLKSTMESKPVCRKRSEDVILKPNPLPKQIIAKPLLSDTWTRDTIPSPEIVIEAEGLEGSLIAGTLTESDKTTPYGSAASDSFKPYISDPTITKPQTSRILKNRIKQFCDVSFFLGPSPTIRYNKIGIDIKVPDKCKTNSLQQSALIHWNPERDYWEHEDEGCSPYLTASEINGRYKTSVCSSLMDIGYNKRKRDTSRTSSNPAAYELVSISIDYINTPPNITTDEINTAEDFFQPVTIETIDLEDDDLLFEISDMPAHANCSITSKGILDCTFEEDFNGDDQITINVTETNLIEGVEANSVLRTIPIHVKPAGDFTDRFFVDPTGKVYSDKRPRMLQTFYTEANVSEIYHAGYIILATTDWDEMFAYDTFTKFIPLGSSTVAIDPVQMYQIYTQNLSLIDHYSTVEAYNVTFSYSKLLNGQMTLSFIATTKKNTFTPSVIMDLYVLSNPCVHGVCSHKFFGPVGCHDLSRSLTFDDFYCVCDVGFTDQWCQTNIDDCATNPCSFLFDCEDLVDAHRCNINIPKLVAIIVGSLIAIGLIVFGVVRICMCVKKHKEAKDALQTRLIKVETASEGEPNPLYRRPQMMRETTDGEIPPFSLFTNKPKIEPAPGGISSMFGLGLKAPTHLLINLSKGRDNKVGITDQDSDTTAKIKTFLRESRQKAFTAPRSTNLAQDEPPKTNAVNHAHVVKQTATPLKAESDTAVHLRRSPDGTLDMDDSSILEGSHSEIADKNKAPVSPMSSSPSLSDTRTTYSFDNAGFEKETPHDLKSSGISVSESGYISDRSSYKTDNDSIRQSRSSLHSSVGVSRPNSRQDQDSHGVERESSASGSMTKSAQKEALPFNATRLTESESVQARANLLGTMGILSTESNFNERAVQDTKERPFSANRNGAAATDQKCQEESKSQLERPLSAKRNDIFNDLGSQIASESKLQRPFSANRIDVVTDRERQREPEFQLEPPVNVITVQQARSTLMSSHLLDKRDTNADVNESSLTNIVESEKNFGRSLSRTGMTADMVKEEGSTGDKALSDLCEMAAISSEPRSSTGAKSSETAKCRTTDGTVSSMENYEQTTATSAKATDGTSTSAHSSEQRHVIEKHVSVSNRTATTQKDMPKQAKSTVKGTDSRPKPAPTTVNYLKGAPVQPHPTTKVVKNYLKGPPPTTLTFLKGPQAKPVDPDNSGKTREELERRNKLMAKHFASLSLAVPKKTGPPQPKTTAAKTKAGSKAKEGKRPEDKPGKTDSTTTASIGSHERPSSAVSDVDV